MADGRRGSILCVACLFPIMTCYLIAAIVIGYINECDNGENDTILDPKLYLKIGGFSMLGTSILVILSRFTIFDSQDRNGPSRTTRNQAGILCIAIIYESIWAIIGCIIYSELSDDCTHSAIGKMILAYVIITLLFNCCNYIAVSQGCSEPSRQPRYSGIAQTDFDQ